MRTRPGHESNGPQRPTEGDRCADAEIQLVHFALSYQSPSPPPPPLDFSCESSSGPPEIPHRASHTLYPPAACGARRQRAAGACLPTAPAESTPPCPAADALVRLLHFNQASATASKAEDEVYKVLVLDKYTKDILAPLLRLNDLRKHGITLHLVRRAASTTISAQAWPCISPR